MVLLVASGFFSLAETAMIAANRYKLKARVQDGHAGSRLALDLLARTDKLLGVILLFNNLINAAAATLVSVITIALFGEHKWALGAGTMVVTFLILVFSEITPKVVGATHADRIAPAVSFVLAPLLRVFYSVVWFVDVFVSGLLALTRLRPGKDAQLPRLSPQELRVLVLESGPFMPQKHKSILLNLFELEDVTMEDVMTPRGAIEAIDIQAQLDEIREKLATSYHTRIPVYDGDPTNVIGILHQRRVLSLLMSGELDKEGLRESLVEPYFIPGTTPIYAQLQYFQEHQQRVALVVDEYGELDGLVTLEDLIEEIIGKFTTSRSLRTPEAGLGGKRQCAGGRRSQFAGDQSQAGVGAAIGGAKDLEWTHSGAFRGYS
ncbi:MAG: CNNM domain-containing protein [Comamonadaceae bacterium]|nr:CNNM domain-containing protein [Comamonadaceae bacterium]